MLPRITIRWVSILWISVFLMQGTSWAYAIQPLAAEPPAEDSRALGAADERQDIPALRTANSKSYRTSIPGQYKEVIYGSNVHYVGSDQHYYDIRTAVTDESAISQMDKPVSREMQGEFQIAKEKRKAADKANKTIPHEEQSFFALQVPYKLILPKNFAKGYTIGSGEDQLTFIPLDARKSIGAIDPSDKSVIRYNNVWPSTTVTLSIRPDGLKEDIILHDAAAPDRFEFEVQGALDRRGTSGALQLLPAWLEDSKGSRRDVAMTTQTKGKKTYIALTWDGEGLSYPIRIDPSVNIAYSNSFYSCSNDAAVYSGSFLVSTELANKCESYLTFYTNIPKNAVISYASVSLSVLVQYSLHYDVTARLLTTSVSQNSSTGKPVYTTTNQTTQFLTDNSGSTGQAYAWDVTGMVTDTFRNGITSIGFYPSDTAYGHVSGVFANAAPALSVYYEVKSSLYQYDANGRLTATRLPSGHLKSNAYDKNGNLTQSFVQYNLLENGDFNQGGANWNVGHPMELSSAVSRDTLSLGFSSAAATAQTSTTSSYPIAVGPHDQFTLSGYVMDNTTSGKVYLTWKEYNYYYGVVSTGSKLLSTSKGTGTWQFKGISFVPSTMTSWMTVEIVADAGTQGTAYFDNVKLSPGIRNADFERGQTEWSHGGIMYVAKPLNNQRAHNNSEYALVFNYPWAASTSVNTTPNIPVEPLKSYVYSAWFHNLSNAGNCTVRLEEYSAGNQWIKSTVLDANNLTGAGWVYKEVGFQTAPSTRCLRIVVQVENGAGTSYADDMRLEYKG